MGAHAHIFARIGIFGSCCSNRKTEDQKMIRNGRPYTNENGVVDDTLVTRHDDAELRKIDGWIRKNIRGSRKICVGHTSYGIKHDLERDTGIYLTNNEFKDAMLLAGYKPVDPDELNWRYRIVLVKDENWNPGPFFRWATKNFADVASPEGDFARDMAADHEFPVFAEHGIIQRYLDGIGACGGAVDAFEKLWEMYERENG